ncbi:MAG: hypothetical protein ACSHXY_09835 [Alphaproteobacteria bacterium]
MANLSAESAIEKLIFCAVETTYATDAVPTGTDALLTEDFKLDAMKTNKVARNIDRAGLGGTEDAIGAFSASGNFKIPLTSSGDAGELPAFTSILRACQFNAAVVADTSVSFNLVSGDMESATIYYYKGDRLRKLKGLRGSAGFQFKNGSVPYIMIEHEALYAVGEDSETAPTPNYGTTQTPSTISFDNTPVFTIGGTALVLMNLDVSAPGNMKHRDAPNQKEVRPSGRRNYSGKATVLQRALTDFDPETLLKTAALSEVYLKHGSEAGGIVEFTASKTQIVGVSEGEEDGDATWELDLNITATGAGDDDIVVKLT